ncbi:filamentous hemagglutinin N-terminal domain-containing protein [uncultured Anaerovibrio sp.]|uniref:two-partner secretion domain-containing protein n=1 Tax=uncultured Anaerovibrio sp. TaxID=361586 RepID=UPI0026089B86|nr:filamentous hemagglutinin N-terminal domain-containing protein [uncultured Anaerovibrio sp.]
MGSIAKFKKRQLSILAAAFVAASWMPTAMAVPANALPTDGGFVSGTTGTIVNRSGEPIQDITLNEKTGIIEWNTFNIGAKAKVNFTGPDNWMALNRVTSDSKSEIYGALNGVGGTVFIVNPNGILFGSNASVDVGSLVATTMNVDNDVFKNFNAENPLVFTRNGDSQKGITIQKLANITARDGYVAILAHNVSNYGTITAPEVAMASGKKITLSYDDKIDLSVDVLNNTEKASNGRDYYTVGNIDTKNGYVLMTTEAAKGLIGSTLIKDSTITNNGVIQVAKAITVKEENGQKVVELSGDGGSINMIASKVLVNGELSADAGTDGTSGGKINTYGYDKLQVQDGANVHAKAENGTPGSWNLKTQTTVIGEGLTEAKVKDNIISSEAVGNALAYTNVNVVASPQKASYYSDIEVKKDIQKSEGSDTGLTLTAGRNVVVDADIKSEAGKLNVILAGDSSNSLGKTISDRGDGANIIRGNIETNGGYFKTERLHAKDGETGEEYLANGTYFGFEDKSKTGEQSDRHIYTKGGDIELGGAEVLLGTGGTVVLDTKSNQADVPDGKVTIDGTVNSANFYDSPATEDNKDITWTEANELANAYDKDADGNPTGKSHLTVITSALEDAVTSSTLKPDEEAYVGGHVVAVETNDDGSIKYVNGLPVAKRDENGNVVTIVNDVTNTIAENDEHRKGGWYVATRDADGKASSYVRFWAWTVGDEAGKIIYMQTAGENVAVDNGYSDAPDNKNGRGNPGFHDMPDYGDTPTNDQEIRWLTEDHGVKLNGAYVNFAPNEPNDGGGRTEGSETALAVNHDTYYDSERGNVLVSKWDDMPDGVGATTEAAKKQIKIHNYAVETEIGKSALTINAGEIVLNKEVGNLSKLQNLTIDSSANVTAKGSVQVENNVIAHAAKDNTFEKLIEADKGQVYLSAGNNISTAAVTAGDLVGLNAGGDVTINDILESKAKDTDSAVEIMAQGSFYNRAEDGANALKVGDNSHWKVYSDSPYNDDFGGLNSNQFAEWGWSGKTTTAGTGNLYIFKYHPTLTFKAKDGGTRMEGTAIDPVGYTYENEMDGKFLNAFLDGDSALFMNRDGMNKANTVAYKVLEDGSSVDNATDGYSADAKAGAYKTFMVNHKAAESWGYKVKDTSGTLTIEPPTDNPPGDNPPTDNPPGDNPPADNPPADNPPADNPPGDNPPADNPPVDNPPVDNPPVDNPPVDNPPVDNPPVDNPPVDNPPVDNPPVDNPPVDNPPVDNPPVDNPPVDNTPVDNTPVDNTPVDNTPVDNTPVDNPPVDNPPADNPPVDNPPVDNPLEKPQLESLITSNSEGTASYTMAQRAQGPGAERVLGLQSAELPFFNERFGTVKLYGTYDVSVDPDKVKMVPTAKVLPEPEQPKNQYRELEKELTTEDGSARFRLTYNGSTLDIYPTDEVSTALLVAGDGKKNVEIESKALFEAFNRMGISLDDLDGVYTHFESMKVSSFRE